MVKRQSAESGSQGHIAQHHGEFAGVKELRHHFCQIGAKVGVELRGFDHHPVAGSQGINGRAQAQIKGVIPGAQNAHHPQRLGQQTVACQPILQLRAHAAHAHPAWQMATRVIQALLKHHQLGHKGFLPSALAKVF